MNVTLMLIKCNLPFGGPSEELSKDNKGNFLSIMQLLAKYDTVLDKLEDSSAIGLHKLITNFIQQMGLDIKNCRGQRYEGAAVISGKYSGLHKKIQDVATHAYYVHCASHNLNLVLKDAMKAVTKTRQFYDTVESVYNFFGHSIVWWQKLQNVHDRSCSNSTLKALNPTWWSGRYDDVYTLKKSFVTLLNA